MSDTTRSSTPIRRPKKTALLIADRIVSLIRDEDLQPGDRLPSEVSMLEQYEVSRGTLREALRFLEFQGVIVLKPGSGGGPFVRHPDAHTLTGTLTLLLQFQKVTFAELIETRMLLEPIVAGEAALKRTDDDLAAIEENIAASADLSIGTAQFHELSDEFHELVAKSSGNALFHNILGALSGTLSGVKQGIEYPVKHREASNHIHKEIFEAISNQNADTAAELMRRHLEAHSDFTHRFFAEQISRPVKWVV